LNGSSDEEDIDGNPKYHQFREDKDIENPHFEIGMEFAKPSEFQALVRNAEILKGFDIIWGKKRRV